MFPHLLLKIKQPLTPVETKIDNMEQTMILTLSDASSLLPDIHPKTQQNAMYCDFLICRQQQQQHRRGLSDVNWETDI